MKNLHTTIFSILATLLMLLNTSVAHSKNFINPDKEELRQARLWADSVMNTLSAEERLEQLIVARLDLKGDAAGKATLRKYIATHRLGGLLLGKGTLADYAAIINEAQATSKVPMMITLDGEWGPAMRVTDAIKFPFNMTLGAISDKALLYSYGREVGRQCRALGINVDFAPVIDVNSNPDNPVIGTRSFGQDPDRVSILGNAYSQGLESMGVLSVAKHFPGHGNTSVDSHHALPTLTASRKELEQVELPPFRNYINAELGGIMVGHLSIPALDKKGTPASLSHKITTGLLKEEMEFKGLVFTDALAMKGANNKRNNCVDAFLAGADILLQPANIVADKKALQQAIAAGEITQAQIDERCRKVLFFKYLMGLSNFTPANTKEIVNIVNSPQATAINQRLANASVTAIRNDAAHLPIRDLRHKKIAIALIGETTGCTFARRCADYASVDIVSAKGSSFTTAQINRLKSADLVVAAVFSDKEWAIRAYNDLPDQSKTASVFFINPYKMSRFKPAISKSKTLLALYQNLPALQHAGAEAVFGGIAVSGRLPVNIEGVGSAGEGVNISKVRLGMSTPEAEGMSATLAHSIDTIVENAIAAGAMTGCQVVVARNGEIVIDSAFGHIDNEDDSPKVTNNTLFDLASVSKTNATLMGLMKAVDEGLILLDDRVGYHIAELDTTDLGNTSVEQLLFHESGLPPVINIYTLAFDPESYEKPLVTATSKGLNTIKIQHEAYGNRKARIDARYYSTKESDEFCYPVANKLFTSQEGIDRMMHTVHTTPLRSNEYRYSCLNFMLLKEIQEAATGVELDQWIDTEIYGPLGAYHTTYLPLDRFDKEDIAATETDPFLRRQKLHGHVHDELAAFSGGIQGNAGLFGNAGDIAILSQMLLNGGCYGGEQIISEATAREFTTRHSRSGRRGLGFDLLRHNSSMWCDKASPNTFGHTGFTGTCYWVDPEQQLIIVFLSNRVCPTRDNAAWSKLNPRGAVIRAVYNSIHSNS